MTTSQAEQKARAAIQRERERLEAEAALILVELDNLDTKLDEANAEEHALWQKLEETGHGEEDWLAAIDKVGQAQDRWLGRKRQLVSRTTRLKELEAPEEVQRRATRIREAAERLKKIGVEL